MIELATRSSGDETAQILGETVGLSADDPMTVASAVARRGDGPEGSWDFANDVLAELNDDDFINGITQQQRDLIRGIRFDNRREFAYPYNQVYLDAIDGSRTPTGQLARFRVDSLGFDTDGNPIIVSRKVSELDDVTVEQLRGDINEARRKYAPNKHVIADVDSRPADLPIGSPLDGQLVLEYPLQRALSDPNNISNELAEKLTNICDHANAIIDRQTGEVLEESVWILDEAGTDLCEGRR